MTDITGISILHIAAAPAARQVLAEYAEMLGWQVHSTVDFAHGLEIAARQSFDVIISEQGNQGSGQFVPTARGFMYQLRVADGPNQQTPVIVTGTDHQPHVKDVAQDAGLDGYLQEPFGLNDLRQAILDALDERVFVRP